MYPFFFKNSTLTPYATIHSYFRTNSKRLCSQLSIQVVHYANFNNHHCLNSTRQGPNYKSILKQHHVRMFLRHNLSSRAQLKLLHSVIAFYVNVIYFQEIELTHIPQHSFRILRVFSLEGKCIGMESIEHNVIIIRIMSVVFSANTFTYCFRYNMKRSTSHQ